MNKDMAMADTVAAMVDMEAVDVEATVKDGDVEGDVDEVCFSSCEEYALISYLRCRHIG